MLLIYGNEPDFSHSTLGLYANLARLKLPYPEAVFDIKYFKSNPLPFYTLAHELAPGRYRPTKTHSFIRLLHEKKYLHTCFTQNIDTLERRAGIPADRIIEAHGSFATQRCIKCKHPFDDIEMKRMIREKEVPKCKRCGGLVKPDIVFFGEALPAEFHKSIYNLASADLLFIMGTSLTVYPFAGLTQLVRKSCPRVLINLDPVGDIGSRIDDVLLLGKCDKMVEDLCKLLGWEKELEDLWAETVNSLDSEEIKVDPPAPTIEEEVKKLTDEVEETLKISEELRGEVQKLTQPSSSKTPFGASGDASKVVKEESDSSESRPGAKKETKESTEGEGLAKAVNVEDKESTKEAGDVGKT
ncbi:hypothetical protein Clacol_007432 [Clathrus columnatus]|uniref:Deacetylase sirtuin-type domain-containing protein n=1 Tax=Clathrus columnatus TaxID=1419009 RepID=A0AAV5AJR5_9AGAM|nr:hypothetical protein Clacol_007432 [Clathrus columnatus]